jgi:hypothetical protein
MCSAVHTNIFTLFSRVITSFVSITLEYRNSLEEIKYMDGGATGLTTMVGIYVIKRGSDIATVDG